MVGLFREQGITGWRRGRKLRFLEKLRAEKLKSERGRIKIIRPDFVFPEGKIAVFVDGDFWHGHPTRAKIPATRREWWAAKIAGNRKRDRLQNRLLRRGGWQVGWVSAFQLSAFQHFSISAFQHFSISKWTVIRIWQHELTWKHGTKALRKLRKACLMQYRSVKKF